MATGKSGSFIVEGNKGVSMKILWSETYDTINNKSVVTITDLQFQDTWWYGFTYYLSGTLSINGTTVVTFNSTLGGHMAKNNALEGYYSIITNSGFDAAPWGDVSVAHADDGTATCPIAINVRGWNTSEKGSNGFTVSGSSDVTLTAIDRAAPTMSFSVSDITANSFKITANASATVDEWSYSLNDGLTGNDFDTTTNTTATTVVTGLTPNTTYQVRVSARKKSNHVYGETKTTNVKTLGGSTINSVSDLTADDNNARIVLGVTVYEAAYTHTLKLTYGGTTHLTISGISGWAKGTASRTINLTAAQRSTLLATMASVKSFTMKFELQTFSGSTQIGNTSICEGIVQTTEVNSGPSMGAFTTRDSRSNTVAVTGNDQYFIQSHSYLEVTPAQATARNGASIVKYAATCNGVTVSNTTGAAINLGAIAKSGAMSVVVTATDTRGYTVSVTQTVNVLAYKAPKLSEISLRRTNDIEEEMQLIFKGTISSIKPDTAECNSLLRVRYRYKLTSATSYGSYTNILSSTTKSGTSFNFSNLELCSLDANASYDFHLQICDQLDSLSALNLYYVIPQGTPLIALRKKKVGINTPNPEAALHVDGAAIVTGSVTAASVSATSLSGSLPVSNLTGTLPIAKGGTGATTAAAAVAAIVNGQSIAPVNISVTGSQYWNSGAYGLHLNNSDIVGINGLWFPDAVDSAGEGINFYRGSGTWDRLYAYGGTLYFAPNIATATHPGTRYGVFHSGSTIPVGNGGTGATSAASARTNLGVSVTSLYSGNLTSGSTTFNYGSYNFYVIIAKPKSTAGLISVTVPKAALTTSAVKYQVADETNYLTFNLSYSGSTVTLAYGSASYAGSITNVYGIN